MAKNVAKGNARVGVQVGGGEVWTRDGQGHKVKRESAGDGVTEVTTYVKRGPNHPAGPGVTKITHYER